MTFAEHMAHVEAVADFDAQVWAEIDQQEAELAAELALERWYESGCGNLRLQDENRRDLDEFDSQFPNGYCA